MCSFVNIVIYPSNTHSEGSESPPGFFLKEERNTHRIGYTDINRTNIITKY